jgi:hypothetical protein
MKAAQYLRGALQEPPQPGVRASMLFELSSIEPRLSVNDRRDHLR